MGRRCSSYISISSVTLTAHILISTDNWYPPARATTCTETEAMVSSKCIGLAPLPNSWTLLASPDPGTSHEGGAAGAPAEPPGSCSQACGCLQRCPRFPTHCVCQPAFVQRWLELGRACRRTLLFGRSGHHKTLEHSTQPALLRPCLAGMGTRHEAFRRIGCGLNGRQLTCACARKLVRCIECDRGWSGPAHLQQESLAMRSMEERCVLLLHKR